MRRPWLPPKDKADVLDAYIIDEIKRQDEERRRREDERPRLRIEIPEPAEAPPPTEERPDEGDEDSDDPVIRIDLADFGRRA